MAYFVGIRHIRAIWYILLDMWGSGTFNFKRKKIN